MTGITEVLRILLARKMSTNKHVSTETPDMRIKNSYFLFVTVFLAGKIKELIHH